MISFLSFSHLGILLQVWGGSRKIPTYQALMKLSSISILWALWVLKGDFLPNVLSWVVWIHAHHLLLCWALSPTGLCGRCDFLLLWLNCGSVISSWDTRLQLDCHSYSLSHRLGQDPTPATWALSQIQSTHPDRPWKWRHLPLFCSFPSK